MNKPVFLCCRLSEACLRQQRVGVDKVSSYVTLHITLSVYLLAVSNASKAACEERADVWKRNRQKYMEIHFYRMYVENQYMFLHSPKTHRHSVICIYTL